MRCRRRRGAQEADQRLSQCRFVDGFGQKGIHATRQRFFSLGSQRARSQRKNGQWSAIEASTADWPSTASMCHSRSNVLAMIMLTALSSAIRTRCRDQVCSLQPRRHPSSLPAHDRWTVQGLCRRTAALWSCQLGLLLIRCCPTHDRRNCSRRIRIPDSSSAIRCCSTWRRAGSGSVSTAPRKSATERTISTSAGT